MEKIKGTAERALKTREELFAQLKTQLDIHLHIQEAILYPLLEKTDESRDITLEAYEEHRRSESNQTDREKIRKKFGLRRHRFAR